MLRKSFLPSLTAIAMLMGPNAGAAETPVVVIKAPAADIPVSAFFEHAAFSDAGLSPDGRTVAMRYAPNGSRVRLAVMDVKTHKIDVIVAPSDADIVSFNWVNENRLTFSLGDRTIGAGQQRLGAGLYAVNRDGSELRELVSRKWLTNEKNKNLLPPNTSFFAVAGKRDTDDVFVLQASYRNDDLEAINLLRLNTRTGRSVAVTRPPRVLQWYLDQNGEPRMAASQDGAETVMNYLDPETGKWRPLTRFDSWSGKGSFEPQAFGPDGTLYVSTENGQDKRALYTYNVKTGKLSAEPLVVLPEHDFEGALIMNDDKVLGVMVQGETASSHWFDPQMQAAQADIDARLPDAVNLVRPARRSKEGIILVQSYSDTSLGALYLYNLQSKELVLFGKSAPRLDPTRMSYKHPVKYTARDGLPIPAYLTLPKGVAPKNLPLVVLVHGGPSVRGGYWGFDPQVQFLASRGYAVLEPDFRGSTGFGRKHESAGWRQWGLAMQNDVADGAKWAAAKGFADPKRICVAGASYGGYAALMGLVNDPDIFKCGVSWVGVTDINLLYSVTWGDMSEEARKYQLPLWIGDREKDAAQLKATSPIEQAARIKRPLIVAYGGADDRVPIVHGTKFYSAVKSHNPDVEWIEYVDEGHGWRSVKTNVDFWGRVETFLNKHIGKPE
uniref:Alpha/beta fold hydrolase n=1 Tax=Pseudoduganella guangdongensis TaxID=2692179 RepID=A0A6N9HEA9_9BURK|nr:alpha/beta fold hydrolase [Pseudoduganella guangdongensis]MYN01492.1 alpha/beta fold hydrolase [Pseudoduganella guangdongensis]